MTAPIAFTVPLEPPSVNMYVRHTRRGRHYVTAEAKAFKQAVAICAAGKSVTAKAYAVDFTVYMGKGSRGDIDNRCKVVLDGLVDAGVIHSDAAVSEVHARRSRDWANPRTEIEVSASTQVQPRKGTNGKGRQ